MTTKPPSWKNDSLPAHQRVEAWLETVGYPLEFRAADVFRKHGYKAHQGQHAATDDGTPLEIDVMAAVGAGGEPPIGLAWFVECKVAPTPWVVFSVADELPRNSVRQRVNSVCGDAAMWLLSRNAEAERSPLFAPTVRRGFALKALKDGKEADDPYAALQGVVERARAVGSVANRRAAAGESLPEGMPVFCNIGLPIIIVGGDLCEAYWSDERKQVAATRRTVRDLFGRSCRDTRPRPVPH
jgi:hypothetical protein